MKLTECAKQGITRVMLVKDGKPVWNKYSFGDIFVTHDGRLGPWLDVYDPCGQMVCGNPIWKKVSVLTVPVVGVPSVLDEDEFEPYHEPPDLEARFPGVPPRRDGRARSPTICPLCNGIGTRQVKRLVERHPRMLPETALVFLLVSPRFVTVTCSDCDGTGLITPTPEAL